MVPPCYHWFPGSPIVASWGNKRRKLRLTQPCLYQSSQTATVRCHSRQRGLNSRNVFSHSTIGQKFKIKVLAWYVFGENTLFGGQLLSVSSQDGEGALVFSSFCKDKSFSLINPALIPTFNLNYLPKSPMSKCSHVGHQGFSIWIWGRVGITDRQESIQLLMHVRVSYSMVCCFVFSGHGTRYYQVKISVQEFADQHSASTRKTSYPVVA